MEKEEWKVIKLSKLGGGYLLGIAKVDICDILYIEI